MSFYALLKHSHSDLLTDAPSDGNQYTRQDGAWAVVSGGAEVNDLTSAVTWANIPDANVPESAVTQHEAALTITESQISDLAHTVPTLGSFVFNYEFSTTTTIADPGAGIFRFNHATPSSVSQAAFSDTDDDGNNIEAHLLNMDYGTHIRVQDPTDPTVNLIFAVEGVASDQVGYVRLLPDHQQGTTWPADGTKVVVTLSLEPYIELGSTIANNAIFNMNNGALRSIDPTQAFINDASPPTGGRFFSGGTASTDRRACGFYLDAGSVSYGGLWYVEGATLNEGFYGGIQSNLGAGADRMDVGYDSASAAAIYKIYENLNFTIDAGASFGIEERAAAVADITGRGQLWVRNDTPNTLVFTDDAGTDFDIGGATASSYVSITEDTTTLYGNLLEIDVSAGNSPQNVLNFVNVAGGPGGVTTVLNMGGTGSASTTWEIFRSTDQTGTTFWSLVDDHILSSSNHRLSFRDEGNDKYIEFDRSNEIRFLGTESAEKMFMSAPLNRVSVRNGATFYIEELAAANVDVGGEGQIWVRTATPNELMFTNDAGTDMQIGGATTENVATGTEHARHTVYHTTAGGMAMEVEDASGIMRLYQTDSAGNLEDILFEANRNATTALFHNGVQKAFTDQGGLGTNDAFYLVGSSSHAFTPGAGSGAIWLDSDDDTLYFRNDSGTDFNLLTTTELLQDTSPQLGGQLETNGFDISFNNAGDHALFADSNGVIFGTGFDFSISWNGTVGRTNMATVNSIWQQEKGIHFRLLDSTDTDYLNIHHDGTDVNFTHATTTDWNITGITAIQAGTVDADFDAITATSYGGITEANLQDKTAAETISGNRTYSAADIFMEDNTIDQAVLQDYAIESDTQNVSGTTATLTYANGPAFQCDMEAATGAVTITLSGGPPSGTHGQITVEVIQDTTVRTLAWAGGTFRWAGGTAHPVTTTANGFTLYTFETWDGGTTWYGAGADYS